jgi:site-specific recombinase XerD
VPGAMLPGVRPGEGLRPNTILHYVTRKCRTQASTCSARTAGRHTACATCASDALDARLNIRVVLGLLGHASISRTEVYLRPAALGDLKEAVDRSYRGEDSAARDEVA